MPVAQPSGYGPEILQPFEIPTSVNAPVRTGPRMNLQFPVFTPPAASSYGSTQPMAIPWSPPNLAGAINEGLKTGASLATSFLTNRKTAQEVQAEEAASKGAIAAMHDPNLRQNIGYEMGPGGFTARILSPAEIAMRQAELAKTQAATEAAQAETAGRLGQTVPSQSEVAAREAETKLKEAQTRIEAQKVMSGFDVAVGNVPAGSNAATSGIIVRAPAAQSGGDGATGTTDGNYLNLGF